MYYDREKFDEIKAQANSVNLIDYLRSRGVELVTKGHEFCTREHDSLSINYEKNTWRQYSQVNPRTGKALSGNPIDYLQRFMHCTYNEAVTELITFGYGPNALSNGQPLPKRPQYQQMHIEEKKEKGPVKLPEKEKGSWRQLFRLFVRIKRQVS